MDFRVTPATERDRDLVAQVALVVVGEMVFLQKRRRAVVAIAAFLEAAAGTLPVATRVPEVRTVRPLPFVLGHGAGKIRCAALVLEEGVLARVGKREATATVVGSMIAQASVGVGVVDAYRGPRRRLLHAPALETPRVTLFARAREGTAVHLEHEPAGDHPESGGETRVLARNVDTADSLLAQMRGLMFRRSIPADYALVFRFGEVDARDVHMLFVPFPIDVLWVVDGSVVRIEELSPWTGLAKERADMLVELPAGAAEDVSVGDRVRLAE